MLYFDNFRNWFLVFMKQMLDGVWEIISHFFLGLGQIFNFGAYASQLQGKNFGWTWILVVLVFILAIAIWGGLILLIVLGIRKYIRFRRTIVGNEDLLEEIADLHRDVLRLTSEKEKIMNMKITQSGLSYSELRAVLGEQDDGGGEGGSGGSGGPKVVIEGASLSADGAVAVNGTGSTANLSKRFARLSAVDEKYVFYQPPKYNKDMSLSEICDDIRNFACYHSRLFYEIKTIRLMIAGLASTKLIVLQGISGTGKTSLPYTLGKYLINDATIASVQPSWRERSELFGYFNEFTKKFNETEVLKRIYESTYNDDINIIILDEMNIARIEYYFAEMLSILEMPDPNEWKIEIVPSSWEDDPKHLPDGKLTIPQNVWYIGTANNDDSTFAVSDKVYDRALVINLDSKGIPFEPQPTSAKSISYSYIESLYKEAVEQYALSDEILDKISKLDLYVIEKFRVAFGNRIMKQLKTFVPVYIACGGTELDGLDYILATKVFRKFESLNLSLIRDEIRGLILFMDNLFGKETMKECIDFLQRLQKTY
ncbi:MAG: hypothetical protein J5762_07060 [Clostridia bacterium]|nr:hypothetical protein [Clostridia bacterium]